ncbi:unnamed protein product [Paramecium primaurelia]|uniref:MORN repeat protein n=1 Tax=Paramecium primaurelia TaxID=5886 RepID=A0A8S1LY06_PARPR|nr:unnamed protein product [Paramecium primaurelia]
MGCAINKGQDIKQFNIKLPDSHNLTSNQTEADLPNSEEQFLQIGMNRYGLGDFLPKVQEVYNKLGELQQNIQGQYLLLPDQSIYFGSVVNGKREGVGKQHWPKEGNLLEGTWIDNQLNGRARMIYPNGDYFIGNFRNNIASGMGLFVTSKKQVQGFWLNNKLTGEGTEIRKNGTIYKGQFNEGKIQGQGQFEYANKCIYKGSVVKGKMHGKGELIFNDNTRYIGEFKANSIQGRGNYQASIQVSGWFHSKFDNKTLFIYFFRSETRILDESQHCTLIEKKLEQFFD